MTVHGTEASTEVLEVEDNGHVAFSTFIIYYHKIINTQVLSKAISYVYYFLLGNHL
jgi:hypothetical protein